jgi:hypothetical protein
MIPLESLPGRGVSVNVAAYYNSRSTWSRHANAVTFNAINTWPYLGFSISFGRIVTYGSDPSTKFILLDPDGTRHYLGSGVSYQTNTYQTNDGTHITYVGNATTGGTIYYNNGTSLGVGLINNRLLVSTVSDTNGNSYSISYLSQGSPANCNNGLGMQWHQAINYIYDSLGRVISFQYDSCNNLVGITAPGIGGTSQNPVTVTVAQFDYTGLTPSTSFSGLTVENASGYIPVLSHIYSPVTQTGYKFQYSAYGMVYNVSKRRQMGIDQNGVISDGLENNHATFNYPLTVSSLTDAPAFTQRTESPGPGGKAPEHVDLGSARAAGRAAIHAARAFQNTADAALVACLGDFVTYPDFGTALNQLASEAHSIDGTIEAYFGSFIELIDRYRAQ